MANMAMAQAVLEHANQYYEDGWYIVAECWDAYSVLEELERHEDATKTPFQLDTAAIGHFAAIACPKRKRH
jgi:hypothetical protein